MSIFWPTNTVEVIDAIRGAIGRDVTFNVLVSTSGCSECGYDPVNDASTDSFCIACSGIYWINTYSGVTVSGHVTWGRSDNLNWRVGGQMFDGDVRIQIKLGSGVTDMLDNTESATVDGKVVEIRKRILRGVQPLNRVLLDCIEREKEA